MPFTPGSPNKIPEFTGCWNLAPGPDLLPFALWERGALKRGGEGRPAHA